MICNIGDPMSLRHPVHKQPFNVLPFRSITWMSILHDYIYTYIFVLYTYIDVYLFFYKYIFVHMFTIRARIALYCNTEHTHAHTHTHTHTHKPSNSCHSDPLWRWLPLTSISHDNIYTYTCLHVYYMWMQHTTPSKSWRADPWHWWAFCTTPRTDEFF